jgi:hypothetical protein
VLFRSIDELLRGPKAPDEFVIQGACPRMLARFNSSAPRWLGADEILKELIAGMNACG